MGRMVTPEEIAQNVVFLCSDAASYIIGQPLVIDDGYTATIDIYKHILVMEMAV
jgi:NAD(P)-dependent dehydrogenase (short-subunit alcohol dehydrogenase family)